MELGLLMPRCWSAPTHGARRRYDQAVAGRQGLGEEAFEDVEPESRVVAKSVGGEVAQASPARDEGALERRAAFDAHETDGDAALLGDQHVCGVVDRECVKGLACDGWEQADVDRTWAEARLEHDRPFRARGNLQAPRGEHLAVALEPHEDLPGPRPCVEHPGEQGCLG